MFELGKGPEERARAIAEATESAVQRAIEAGAFAESCQACFCDGAGGCLKSLVLLPLSSDI